MSFFTVVSFISVGTTLGKAVAVTFSTSFFMNSFLALLPLQSAAHLPRLLHQGMTHKLIAIVAILKAYLNCFSCTMLASEYPQKNTFSTGRGGYFAGFSNATICLLPWLNRVMHLLGIFLEYIFMVSSAFFSDIFILLHCENVGVFAHSRPRAKSFAPTFSYASSAQSTCSLIV